MQNRKFLPFIIPLLLISILFGIWTAWIRIGWNFPLNAIAGKHGALMVGSFLGSLISLERTVILKNKWAILVPISSAGSIVFFLSGQDYIAFLLLSIGSLGQCIIMGYFLEKHKQYFLAIMFTGSICWLIGNLMLLVWGMYPLAVPWWIAFLLLMITGERMELTRFLPLKKIQVHLLLAFIILYLIGNLLPFHGEGRYVNALGLILIGIWLLKYDMARKAVKKKGQQAYSALLLLIGYFWLMLSGILLMMGDAFPFIYDAVLHSFFLGFVFSMIFAHGPIILPGILGSNIKPYHPFLYLPALLLQLSLALRIFADLYPMAELRKWAGMLNGIAILLFFVGMFVLIRYKSRKKLKNAHQLD